MRMRSCIAFGANTERMRCLRSAAFIIIAFLCVAVGVAGPSFAADGLAATVSHEGHRGEELHAMAPPGPGASPFVREMEADMLKMLDAMHAPGFSGDPDIDFLAMMIPHHQGAIDMARLVLIHGDDPHARHLAEGIIASQQAEIDAMRARLQLLGKARGGSVEEYPALTGTRGTAAGTEGATPPVLMKGGREGHCEQGHQCRPR